MFCFVSSWDAHPDSIPCLSSLLFNVLFAMPNARAVCFLLYPK